MSKVYGVKKNANICYHILLCMHLQPNFGKKKHGQILSIRVLYYGNAINLAS
ncbi:hypothetical protein SAMN04488511_103202 [Pedobacter suwonensis]|uniref:Uncharacterized protein n=1 Tax=Pedobacter suwonensis TaxID=332999 RepID=A0A1I0STS5_9SPHI|nr:hypothetical protein SAMN04488511_103202 [Pedobacter suwonensis]